MLRSSNDSSYQPPQQILLNIIMSRIIKQLDVEVSDTQAGFRKNRGTRDHLFNLANIIQKHNDFNEDLRICFIDYSKAFDCVSHDKLWEILREMNFEPKIVNLIKSLYHEQQASVRLEKSDTESFTVGKGVRQGCILSPNLFSIYTESIMRNVEEDPRSSQYEEVILQGRIIRDLRYADDTALLSRTVEGLGHLVDAVKEHSEAKDLMLNVKKTKVMDTDKCRTKTDLQIDGETLENVTHFEYLGARVENDGRSKNEISRRIAIASQKLGNLKKIWESHCNNLKLDLLRACIFPVVLYGCEAWAPLATDLDRLRSFEMKCYRKILKIVWTDKITNQEVRNRLQIQNSYLIAQYVKLKLSYFGHVKRHDTIEKTVLEGKLEGKRSRGKPRRGWADDISHWLGMSIASAGMLAQDRDQYRRCSQAATSQAAEFPPPRKSTRRNDEVSRDMLRM